MVAVIHTSSSIQFILSYNENKIKEGHAECINAVNYPLALEKLSFTSKLNRFLNLTNLNENTKQNSVHISLNFHPSEYHSKEKLNEIAETYMEKIGFGKQPYLVYQHHDAGHPHLHLVTINIQRDGTPIALYRIGLWRSEPARKEIETQFSLVKAQGQKNNEDFSLQSISVGRIQYGKVESKKAMSILLNKVLKEYKFSSFSELNALLKQYNLVADRGKEGSKIYQNRGLLYRILDKEGKIIGVPIKASSFYFKPMLNFLEQQFKENEIRTISDKSRVKNSIDIALFKKGLSIADFIKELNKEGINVVLRTSASGSFNDITYVDHKTKNVFSGSSLGEQYSGLGIQERCGLLLDEVKTTSRVLKLDRIQSESDLETTIDIQSEGQSLQLLAKKENILDPVRQSEQSSEYQSYQLKNKRKNGLKNGL